MFAGFGRAPRRRLVCLALVLVAASTVGRADRLGRAVELHDQGRRAEARELLEAIVREEPANHRALWNCGLLAMQDEQWDDAVSWFERAIDQDGADSEYHLWRGYAYTRKLEASFWLKKLVIAPKIRRAFERAVELDPSSVKAREALLRYYERAPGFLGGGRDRAAEQAEALSRLSGEPSGPR